MFIPSLKTYQLKNGKREKTLLLLNNAPTHQSCDIVNEKANFIKVMFLPPNVTYLLQLMDQDVIETFKRYYRKELLRKLILEKEEEGEGSLIRNNKKIDLKDASYMIEAAWNSKKEQNLKNLCNKVLCLVEIPESEYVNEKQGDMSEMTDMLKKLNCDECDEEVQQWMDFDYDDPGYQIMQDSEILDLMTNKTDTTTNTSSTASSDNENENIIVYSEAFTCLNIVLRWFKTQAESDQYQIFVLKKIRNLAARKRVSLLR